MDLVEKKPLYPGDTFSVRVFVDTEPARPGEQSQELHIATSKSTETLSVDVWIGATEHFGIRGTREKVLQIPIASDRSPSLQFDIAVRQNVQKLTNARLWAYFTYESRPSGQVSISVPIVRDAMKKRLPVVPPQPPPAGPPEPPAIFTIDRRARKADLTIEVANPSGDLRSFECRISSPHIQPAPEKSPCEWNLRQETGDLVLALFGQFLRPDVPPVARLASLRGAGIELWEAAPPIVRDAIWQLIDDGKLQTILVVSSDPNIPWELMIPSRYEGGKREDRKPLGVEFAIGRWVPVDHRSPPQRAPLTRSLVIAPNYPASDYPGGAPKPLPHAEVEASMVCARVPGQNLKPAGFEQVEKSLFGSQVDLVHFACHGVADCAPGIQALYLEDRPFDSIQMKGLPFPDDPDTPFVFLNACEVGRQVPTLNGIGGFAREFIARGATGVVAPLWSVKDEIAHDVAITFYNRLAENPTTSFAEIMRDIRTRAYRDGQFEDTYAAYCFYGDPFATVK
jgi:hypothetical protein